MDVRCTQAYTQAHTRNTNKLKCDLRSVGSCYHSPWGAQTIKDSDCQLHGTEDVRQKSHWSFLCININTCLKWHPDSPPLDWHLLPRQIFSQKMLPKPLSDSEKSRPFHNNAPIYTVLLTLGCCRVLCLLFKQKNLYAWFLSDCGSAVILNSWNFQF